MLTWIGRLIVSAVLTSAVLFAQADGQGVEVKSPYGILYRTGVEYPAEAGAKSVSGDVLVMVFVNESGEVIDARISTGALELRKAVLQSVLGWRFNTEPRLPGSFEVMVRFDATKIARRQDGSQPERIRVGGNVQAANLIKKVTPAYPLEAKEARIQGTVRFSVVIAKDGTVQHIQLVSGHPLLVPSSVEALKQWVYKPTLLNGQPVEVITQVDINFTMSVE